MIIWSSFDTLSTLVYSQYHFSISHRCDEWVIIYLLFIFFVCTFYYDNQ